MPDNVVTVERTIAAPAGRIFDYLADLVRTRPGDPALGFARVTPPR